MRSFKNCHEDKLTACVYSPTAKLIITSSHDATIKVWSVAGDFVDSLSGHTKSVTSLLLSPYNANIFLSSSADGTVKVWSLDIMQSLYEYEVVDRTFRGHFLIGCFLSQRLNLFGEIWSMGFTDDLLFYTATKNKIALYHLTDFLDFSAYIRLVNSDEKFTGFCPGLYTDRITRDNTVRLLKSDMDDNLFACTDNNTVHLFDRKTWEELAVVYPISHMSERAKFVVHSRKSNIIYFLNSNDSIWLYDTKYELCFVFKRIDTFNQLA
jgi:WD40 repeat protein